MNQSLYIMGFALLLSGCDPYNYSRFNEAPSYHQAYIGFHKVCLREMQSMGLRPLDKSAWAYGTLGNAYGDTEYGVVFYSIMGTEDNISCTIKVDDIEKIEISRFPKSDRSDWLPPA